MSHTSQRRGLDPANPDEEIIVLAMIPKQHLQDVGIHEAMKTLAQKMMAHNPHQWLSRNFITLDIPQLGSKQTLLRWMQWLRPEATRDMLFKAVAEQSNVLTAIYTKEEDVCGLLRDLSGSWLQENRRRGTPVSIVLSGLFGDIDECCKRTGFRQHTYLYSLGCRGRVDRLPGDTELELMTMCGHGLIAGRRIQHLVEQIGKGEITAAQAAADVARPCVCGIVNQERAARIFRRLAVRPSRSSPET
jgi:hypothetical protein